MALIQTCRSALTYQPPPARNQLELQELGDVLRKAWRSGNAFIQTGVLGRSSDWIMYS